MYTVSESEKGGKPVTFWKEMQLLDNIHYNTHFVQSNAFKSMLEYARTNIRLESRG